MEQKQSQEYAPMKESNEKSISVTRAELYDNSPFGIVEVNVDGENKCFIALGERRLTELQTREACEKEINEKSWRITIELIMGLVEKQDLIIKYKKGGNSTLEQAIENKNNT